MEREKEFEYKVKSSFLKLAICKYAQTSTLNEILNTSLNEDGN